MTVSGAGGLYPSELCGLTAKTNKILNLIYESAQKVTKMAM